MGTYGYGLHAPLAYGYGYPSVYSGVHYYGKRSADAEPKAEADPYVLYSGLGYAGHYGYAGHCYGKRSADAEPKADAYYGYYGYARPYGGYYGYMHHEGPQKLNRTERPTDPTVFNEM